MDNSTAVCYIKKGWGTRSDEMTSVANQLTEFCEERRLTVVAVHLTGVMNIEADKESRSQSDASDLLLKRSVFKMLTNICPVNIDLFSSFWNAKLRSFVSWRPTVVNLFSLKWGDYDECALPPPPFL